MLYIFFRHSYTFPGFFIVHVLGFEIRLTTSYEKRVAGCVITQSQPGVPLRQEESGGGTRGFQLAPLGPEPVWIPVPLASAVV